MALLRRRREYYEAVGDPSLTNGMLVTLVLDRPTRTLTINEQCCILPEQSDRFCCTLPESVGKKDLRTPLCIGVRNGLYVIRYGHNNYLQFLLVNRKEKTVQSFEDSVRYFSSQFLLATPSPCHISPDCSKILIRLPYEILSSREWSKLLSADVYKTETGLRATDLRDERLQDRSNQAVVFDPRFKARVVFFVVNDDGSQVRVRVQDLEKTCRVLEECQVSLPQSYSEDGEIENWVFHHCNVIICRGREVAVLCSVLFSEHGQYKAKLAFLDMEDFGLIDCSDVNLPYGDFTGPVMMTSLCDTKLLLFAVSKDQYDLAKLDIQVPIPKPLNLKGSCRTVIVQRCPQNQIDALQIPEELMSYLRFE